jgi:hypothetical protein
MPLENDAITETLGELHRAGNVRRALIEVRDCASSILKFVFMPVTFDKPVMTS